MNQLQVREHRAAFGLSGVHDPQIELARDIDIAGASLGLNDRIECQLSPSLVRQEEMQHAVDDYGFLSAKIPLCLIGSRILCASRLRVRYSDFGHNYDVIWSGLAGVF
jgi:hypothetical protein